MNSHSEYMEHRIIVNMACGLANRMFQYAFYQYLLKNGYDVYVDYFTTKTLAHEEVAWERIFPQAIFRQASEKDIRSLGGGHDLFSKIRRKFFPYLTSVLEMQTAFEVVLPPRDKGVYLLGVFQNAGIVEAVDSEIRCAFVFPEFEQDRNIRFAQELRTCNSVGIHVRKGKDYQSRIWYQNTCDVDYYKKAVDYIRETVSDPKYYIFTDNVSWVKDNMHWLDYHLVEGNPGVGWGSHCDMHLMSLCQHNIISNSTYSWWGAYLNENKDKLVVCPEIWFNPQATEEYSSERLLAKRWIAL